MKKETHDYFAAIIGGFNSGAKIPDGAMRAFSEYNHSIKGGYETEDFIDSGIRINSNTADYAEAIKAAGLDSFILIDESTALMEKLHEYEKHGLVYDGLVTIKQKSCMPKTEFDILRGIKIKVVR